AVTLAPESPDGWTRLGSALHRAGDDAEALEPLQKSIDLRHGGDGAEWFAMGAAGPREGRIDDAERWLARAEAWRDLGAAEGCGAGGSFFPRPLHPTSSRQPRSRLASGPRSAGRRDARSGVARRMDAPRLRAPPRGRRRGGARAAAEVDRPPPRRRRSRVVRDGRRRPA